MHIQLPNPNKYPLKFASKRLFKEKFDSYETLEQKIFLLLVEASTQNTYYPYKNKIQCIVETKSWGKRRSIPDLLRLYKTYIEHDLSKEEILEFIKIMFYIIFLVKEVNITTNFCSDVRKFVCRKTDLTYILQINELPLKDWDLGEALFEFIISEDSSQDIKTVYETLHNPDKITLELIDKDILIYINMYEIPQYKYVKIPIGGYKK